jgi:prolyl-tRNA editing enzyme YbaK/EbsC (Cys-tRNA(Pro) deacylase)
MDFGTLTFLPVSEHFDLVATPVKKMLEVLDASDVYVGEIDASLSDTAAFCAQYQVGMEQGANCVIVESKRGDRVWYAACVILGSDRVDVNGAVKKQLDARRVSFAPMDSAVALTGMEYGGITPVGLPDDWPLLVDESVANAEWVIIGSGVRASKLLVSGAFLASLPNANVLAIAKRG